MCDQGSIQNLCFDDCQQEACNYQDEQFQDAQSCVNCEISPCYPPQCNQCSTPPSRFTETRQCGSANGSYAMQYSNNNQSQLESFQQQNYENCDPCFDPCEPCVQRCDPCEPLGPSQMPCDDPCTPRFSCPPLDIANPMCSPFRRYIQPPRRESCKPVICYQRPSMPMADDTIYKKSFDFIDSQTAASCRMPPIRPSGQLRPPCGEFAKETIAKLSYAPLCCPDRATPILPRSHRLLGNGPMQGLTTQKHDFVPKFQYQRLKCFPRDNITRRSGCVENSTIQRLSFLSPDLCNFSKAESCKPVNYYKRPELPMEFETTQKLSFMPVCPPPKEDFPWTRKAQYCPPSLQFAKDTVAKLSYQPPGCFMDDNGFCCNLECESSPRASC